MADQSQIRFIANPIQKQFIESHAEADLFSSRMGEGKSAALAWSVFYHTIHNPGADWAMIRDTGINLQRSTMKEFFSWFPPGVLGDYHKTDKLWTWKPGVAEGTVLFLGLDEPADATKLMSVPLAGFAMDEPAPAQGSAGIDEIVFDLAMTRLRQKGMKWYAAKLAENNPDEAHWTYKKFVSPGVDGYMLHQPIRPENQANLPADYYEKMRKNLAHRPDLIRRFVEGEFGFQAEGRPVTPQWQDKLHLALGLYPIPRHEIILLWDWGHNPTCIITQKTPMGSLNVLDALVGDEMGAEELVEGSVVPLLQERYPKCPIRHIGDPAGEAGEQTSVYRSAVRYVVKRLRGPWQKGPVRLEERIEPLRYALSRTMVGKDGYPRGLIQVDRDRAKAVWHALRGGWHFHVTRTGLTAGKPKKDIHSHPGDAMSYGAAVLFPLGSLDKRTDSQLRPSAPASYFNRNPSHFQIGPEPATIPKHGEILRITQPLIGVK